MEMSSVHTVKKGDCLSSIAKQYGFRDYKVIYDDPNNKDFKKARPDPNVIYEGDELFIPDPKQSTKEVSVPTGQKHKFQVKLSKTLLRIVVKDEDEKPLAGKKYELALGDEIIKATTDGDGIVEQKIDPSITAGKLTVWIDDYDKGAHFHWDVSIGHLDPIETIEGVQARLNNLGFYCGKVDGVAGRLTAAALKGFQFAAGIKVTGKLDDDTKKKLLDAHGKT